MSHGFLGRQVIVVLCVEMQAQQPAGQEGHGNNRRNWSATSHPISISGGASHVLPQCA
ncbi:MAG: hypothetical protein IPM70_12715 [Proteobacteria bacterium]|nr:hypothetical protein [Pseudomonadota bacterium]MBK9252685.1 hypothetical protein [Pseudomonadota bacterium]